MECILIISFNNQQITQIFLKIATLALGVGCRPLAHRLHIAVGG
jgi:hypothetical protein